jgi:hypothetical protein
MADSGLREQVHRAAEVAAPPPHLADVARRARVLRWRRGGAATVVAVIAALAIALPLSRLAGLRGDERSREPGGTRVGAIGFDPAPGWTMAASDPSSPEWPPTVWVTNGSFDEGDLAKAHEKDGVTRFDIGPEATIAHLAPDRIVITADVVYVSRNPLPETPTFPSTELPLRLPTAPPETDWEGGRPGHSLHGVVGTVHGRWISVRIEYGSAHPDAAMLRAAQEELDRLVVDPAPQTIRDIDQFGISLAVPPGWEGRLFAWTSGPPTLELSTRPLDQLTGDPAIPNRDRLGALDASIVLAEDDTADLGFVRIQMPITIRDEDRCDGCEVLDDGSTPPPGHALYRRTFSIAGRSFRLYVEFGSSLPPPSTWQMVDGLLGDIRVAGGAFTESASPSPGP